MRENNAPNGLWAWELQILILSSLLGHSAHREDSVFLWKYTLLAIFCGVGPPNLNLKNSLA